MGFMDEIKAKASDLEQVKEAVAAHGDQIDTAVDKATDVVDQATGGSSAAITETVDKVVDDLTDKL